VDLGEEVQEEVFFNNILLLFRRERKPKSFQIHQFREKCPKIVENVQT
jgi:hypothetical protein